jgi:hypothetical protein
MKKLFIPLIITILLFSFFNSTIFAQSQPYNLIIDNIAESDFERAYHWINITQEDFPDSHEAEMANLLEIPFKVGEEFAINRIKLSFLVGILEAPSFRRDIYRNNLDKITNLNNKMDFNKEDITKLVKKFVDNYSKDKIYKFKLKSIGEDINTFSMGKVSKFAEGNLTSNDNIDEIIESFRKGSIAYNLMQFKSLEKTNNMEKRGEMFYTLARSLKVLISNKDKSEYENMSEFEINKELKNLTINILDLSMEHVSKYSDTAVDIENLKNEILEK